MPPTPDEVMSASEQHILVGLPPLTAEDKARFTKIFYANNPKNGVLSGTFSHSSNHQGPQLTSLYLPGAQAHQLLLKSNLPRETLSQIWYVY